MKVLVDTSIIVDVDRGRAEVIELCRKLTSEHMVLVSTVTVSEILTGSYLRKDYSNAVRKAERVLGQFSWIPLDGEVARTIAQLNSFLIVHGLPIEYQDVAIAASCLVRDCDVLLTDNKEHFLRMAKIKDRVLAPKELISVLKANGKRAT